jgi:hypothetical protein
VGFSNKTDHLRGVIMHRSWKIRSILLAILFFAGLPAQAVPAQPVLPGDAAVTYLKVELEDLEPGHFIVIGGSYPAGDDTTVRGITNGPGSLITYRLERDGIEISSGTTTADGTGVYAFDFTDTDGFVIGLKTGDRITVSEAGYADNVQVMPALALSTDVSRRRVSGKAPAGAVVTITVRETASDPVTADSSGVFVADFTTKLDYMKHGEQVDASAIDPATGNGIEWWGVAASVQVEVFGDEVLGRTGHIGYGEHTFTLSVRNSYNEILLSETVTADDLGAFRTNLDMNLMPNYELRFEFPSGELWANHLVNLPILVDRQTNTVSGSIGWSTGTDVVVQLQDMPGNRWEILRTTMTPSYVYSVQFTRYTITPGDIIHVTHYQADGDRKYRRLVVPPNGTVMVTSPADSGPGILREALANVAPGGTIRFDPALAGKRIQLVTPLVIDRDVTIDGYIPSHIEAPFLAVGLGGNNRTQLVQVNAGVQAVFQDFLFEYGQAEESGGAIFNAGNLSVERCVFIFNDAEGHGGAIYNAAGATLDVVNSAFESNRAFYGNGGGIANAGTAKISFSSFDSELGLTGGNLYNAGTLDFDHNILGNTNAEIGGDCANDGTIGSNTNNWIEDGSCGATFRGDSLMGRLEYDRVYGRSGIYLYSGSPAIDAASDEACPETDIRRASRPQGAGCDLGSFEKDDPYLVTLPATNVRLTEATLRAEAYLLGESDQVRFEYGLSMVNRTIVPAGSDGGAAYSVQLTGLQPWKTYYYRVSTLGPDGSVIGVERTFLTRLDLYLPAIGR